LKDFGRQLPGGRTQVYEWLDKKACPSRVDHAKPAELTNMATSHKLSVWCERQCRPEMILEYKIGFKRGCDELVATIDDQTVKVGELNSKTMHEWRSFFRDRKEFVKALAECKLIVGDGFEQAVFPSQTGSKLTLHCSRCKLDRGNVVELETGHLGIVTHRVGSTVTVMQRDFWSQQLVGHRRSCMDQLPQHTRREGCGAEWLCCSSQLSQLACVKRTDLQDLVAQSKGNNKDACRFFTPSGIRSSGSSNSGVVKEVLFSSSWDCRYATSDSFDIGHWTLKKKRWSVKSVLQLQPSPEKDESVDPCSWVAGAVSRTKNLEAAGDCKCPKWGKKVHCGEWVSNGRKFFLRDLQSVNHTCAKVNGTNRRCAGHGVIAGLLG